MTDYKITEDDLFLIKEALSVLKENFDDGIYHHTVGCGLRSQEGHVFTGVNCDGIHGACAEYVTMGSAISSGQRNFDTIVACHEHAINGVVAPCGNCRQMLLDYAPGIKVIVNNDKGQLIKLSIEDLLPFPYCKVQCPEEKE